jgi:UMF1 family MFS transporter
MVLALVLFGIGFIGAEYALIFVNSQLPSVATAEDVGSTSGSGFAFGYLGGLASLAIMLVFFQTMDGGRTIVGLEPALGLDAAQDEDKRIVGPLAAAWYVVFMIPYFLWVRDADTAPKGTGFVGAMALLKKSVANLPNRKSLLAYLGSSMFYRDALNGLYSFGGTYATLVLDWSIVRVGIFGIVSAVAAAAFSWVGGRLDKRYGPKPVIVVAVWILIGVCITIVSMDRTMFFGIPLEEGSALPDIVFFGCGILIGGLGGTLQSASRSLMVRHTDPAVPTESFGLYGLSGRATAFVAPALIGLVTYISGSARIGVTPLILLFLVGLILLRWVQAKGDSETWSVS